MSLPTSEVTARTGATPRQLIYWAAQGYVTPQQRDSGPGNPFFWTDGDVCAIRRAMARHAWGMTIEAAFRPVDPPLPP